ncbi:MAG: helix-turn-helix domain-containing protein [Nitrososphaeria archaeon]|jgi:excisionase family DNA binding protein
MLGDKLGQSDRETPLKDLANALQDKSILNKKYLTVEEVSKVLRISQGTFRSWVNRGNVPFPVIKLGKRILVDEDDLEEYLTNAKRFPLKEGESEST